MTSPSASTSHSADFIGLEGASYRYPKAKNDVFLRLNLRIARGEQVALIGESGGGKSTLLYALAAMLRLDAGSYKFDGRAIHGLSDKEIDAWRSTHVGFVYQQAALLPHLSLLDNVLLPVAHERASKAQWVAPGMTFWSTGKPRPRKNGMACSMSIFKKS